VTLLLGGTASPRCQPPRITPHGRRSSTGRRRRSCTHNCWHKRTRNRSRSWTPRRGEMNCL
jgi:hypothetical protein